MRIRKRTCHLTVVLRHDPSLAEAAAREGGGRRVGQPARATIEATQRARRTGQGRRRGRRRDRRAGRRGRGSRGGAQAEATSPGRPPPPRHPRAAAEAQVAEEEAPAAEAPAPVGEEALPAAEAVSEDEATPNEEGEVSSARDPSRRAPRRHHPRVEVRLVLRERGTSARTWKPRTFASASTSSGKLSHAGLSDIYIRKDKQRITIDIYTARPGIVIGKSGSEVDALRREVHAMTTEERPHQHQRDQAPRARRQARRAVDRRAAPRTASSFRRAMKRSLASAIRSGAARREDRLRRPPRRLRDEPLRDLLGGPRAAAHDPRRHRLRPDRGTRRPPAASA